MLEANQLEYRSKLCEKELRRSSFDIECAMLGASPRKIRSMDASGARRMAGIVSGVTIEPQFGKQVVCQDLTGELSDSLSEVRKETHSWKTKWRHVFVNHKPKSSTVVCCHERELCGFVHGNDFIIITGDYVQLIWIESRLKEGLDFERCADLGVDDGVDKTVTILSQLVTWNDQTGILLARMSIDGFDICVVLCCGCNVRISTPRNSIARTNQEFERYANVEILEFIHVYITCCQTEEGPMRIMNAHKLTIF